MKRNLSKKLTHNLGYKIVAILLAIMLWLVVVNIDDPSKTDTIYNIPIKILNADTITSQDKVYTIISSETAFVNVKGPRSYIDKLKAEDFEATADFTTLSITNAVTVEVQWSDLGNDFSKRVEIVGSTTTINVQLEDINSKSLDVKINYIGEPAEGYVINDVVSSVETVIVSAPQSILSKISTVGVLVDVTDKTEDFSVSTVTKLYDVSGKEILQDEYTTINYNSINVDVQIYKTKTVPIKVSSIGIPGIGYELSILTLSNENVIIKGKEEDLSVISAITIPADIINITGAVSNLEVNVNLSNYLPNNVLLKDESANVVTVTAYIVKQGEEIFQISSSSVQFQNKPAGLKGTIILPLPNISFNVIGATDTFDISKVTAYVDLTGAVKGTSSYVLNLSLPEGELASQVMVSVNVEDETP